MADPRPPREGLGAFVAQDRRLDRRLRELSAPTASQREAYGARIAALESRVSALEAALAPAAVHAADTVYFASSASSDTDA